MKYIKQQILHERKAGDRQLVITADGNVELTPISGTVTINGDLRVTGNATGATNELIYYVSLDGNDDNDGLGASPDRAKKTVKAAVEAAPAGATIKLAPGDYYEDNPITMKERQTVRGDSLRNCQIWPLNNTQDIFLMDNACYLFQVTFRGLRDPGWCARIRPGALVTVSPYVQNCTNMNGPWLNDGTEFIPYETVQIEGVAPTARPIINNENVPLAKRVNETGGGNGLLCDGNDYDQRSLVYSFVADAFTQIAQGGIGFHITNFGYTQIVSCFTVFCRTGFLATKGGYLSISNSVSDFGTYGIIADGLFDEVYTTARPVQDYYSTVGSITVNNQGAGYTSTPAVVIDPPTTPGGVQATATATLDNTTGKVTAVSINDGGSGYDFQPTITFIGGGYTTTATATVNLVTNRTVEVNSLRDQPQVGSIIQFEGDSTYYYVTETNVTSQPFIYNETICRRDVRRIVDAVVGDMSLGTNYQALAAGRSYLRSTTKVVLQQQLEPTIYGIEAARDEMLALIPDSNPANLDARYDIIERFAEIVNIISQGDSTAAPDIFWNDALVPTTTAAAKDNIIANREFIIDEITNYISEQFTDLSYNQDKCARDTTTITIGTSYDVAFGTNYNTVTSGNAYARAQAAGVTDRQLAQTLASFTYLKGRMQDLSAVSSSTTATARVTNNLDQILNIIQGLNYNETTCRRDTGYIVDSLRWDVLLGTNYNAVTTGLSYQRAPSSYVQSEQFRQTIKAIEYLKDVSASTYMVSNATAVSRSNAAFNEIIDIVQGGGYDQTLCRRDVGYIIDSVAYDALFGTNYNAVTAGLSYQRAPSAYVLSDQFQQTVAAIGYLKTTSAADYLVGDATAVSRSNAAFDEILDIVNNGVGSADAITWTDPGINVNKAYARTLLQDNRDYIATQLTSWINANYPSLDYVEATCQRDVKYIVDAICFDIQYGGNFASRRAADAYFSGAVSILPTDQQNITALAMDQLSSIVSQIVIENYPSQSTTGNPASSSESEEAAGLIDIISDVIAANSLSGLPTLIAPGTSWVSAGIVSAVDNYTTNTSTIQDDIIDRINKDLYTNADALTWTNPGVDANKAYARILLQANRDYIATELTSWINSTYPLLTYDEDTCARDVKYIVDALSFDVQYTSNFATRRAADAYFSGAVSVLPAAQKVQTAAAMAQLASIVSAVVTETYAGQTTTGNPASSTEATEVDGLVQIIEDVITADSLSGLPAPVEPDISWVSSGIRNAVNNWANNKNNIIDDTIEEITINLTNSEPLVFPDSGFQFRENARDQLQANRTFIQEEVIRWIAVYYPDLTYDDKRCRRDVGFIVDAITYDILYGGNSATRQVAESYYVGTLAQLGTDDDQIAATLAAYEHLYEVCSTIIQGLTVVKSAGNDLVQDTSSSNGTGVEGDRATDLINIIRTVIDDGNLDNLEAVNYPSITWVSSELQDAQTALYAQRNNFATDVNTYILTNYPTFTYDREKCKRDVSLIIDAVSRDIRLNTNHNTIVAGLAYRRATASVVDADQLPATLMAIRYLGTLVEDAVSGSATLVSRVQDRFDIIEGVIETGTLPSEGTTYPSPAPASQELIDGARQLQDNRDFLVEETIAWINDNYFIYDASKCSRDTQYILDAVAWDMVLGTNANSVQVGLAYRNANASVVIADQLTETVGAITHLKSQVGTLLAADASSVTRTNAAFDEIIDIISNGTAAADPLSWTDPGVDANKRYAREQLQTNRTFIQAEIISWINTTYPLLSYDSTKCSRDVGYIVDAISHDVQYGGNLATKAAARMYFTGTASVLPTGEKSATAAAYNRLGQVVGDIVQELPVVKTGTYPETQDTAGTAASSTETDEVAGLVAIIEDVIIADSIAGMPTDDEPSTAWVASNYTSSKELIDARGDSTTADLVQSVIDYINTTYNGLSYNEELCRRDSGYLVDAVTHDMLYGGNRSTLISTRSYFDTGVTQIYGQESETAAALEHLRDVATQVIEGASVTPTTGNPESQVLTPGFGTSTQSAISEGLFNIVIDALTAGSLTGTPSNSNPDYTWLSAEITLAIANLTSLDSTIQQQVIDYISENIISFSYDVAKCQRDTSYIVDAALYDMMYGGNKESRRCGEAYYNGAILGSTNYGTADQIAVTEFTYKRLANILSDIAQNIAISPSAGVTLSQTITASDGSSAAGSYIKNMVDKLADVVKNGTTALPTEVDHDYTNYGDATLNATRLLILDNLDAIEDESIRLLNLEYGGVALLTLFPGVLSVTEGTQGNMQNVSTVSTSGHAFEYVGAGITYNALPFFGGSPIAENEFVETNVGKVFAGGTVDQIGNFKVGNFFNVNALTGAITLNANEINLSGISSIGPFQRDGIPVGVELKEVSDSTNLIASTGTSDPNTVPTQNAVVNYVENRYLNKLTGGTVEGDVTFETNIAVDGGELTTISTTFDLIPDNANVVNFATGATDITIGATIGTTTIRNDVVIDGTVDITGDTVIIGDVSITIPDETAQAFSISEGTEDYISINTQEGFEKITIGGQPQVEIQNTTQAESGTTNTGALVVDGGVGIAKNVSIGGDLYFEGTIISTSSGSLSLFNNAAGTVDAFGAATEINLGSAGITPGNFVVNNDYIKFTSVYNMKVPTGSIGQRGDTPESGYIRFNTTLGIFEGYDGIAWNGLGGVRDVDGNTYIKPESAPGANENELMFYTDGIERMNLGNTILRVDDTVTYIHFEGTTQSNSPDTGQLVVEGGVGIEKNLHVRGDVRGYNNAIFEGDLTATGSVTFGTLDSIVDAFEVNANSVFNVWDNTVQAFEILEGANSYLKVTTTDGNEIITLGTPRLLINNTTASTDYLTGAVVIDGGVGIAGNLNVAGGFSVGGSISFGDDAANDTFTVVGATDFTIPDNSGAAFVIDEGTNNYLTIDTTNSSELITIGTTPQVYIANTTDASDKDTGALVVDGGVGIELNTYIGVDLFVGRNTELTGDLAVNGGDLTTTATTFNLINTDATTVNFAGAATTINIGAATGTITFNNDYFVFDSLEAIKIPVGATGDRPTAETGQIRFNTTTSVFEGYDGIAWGSLGGVKDVDQNTFIRPETSPGANNDELEFFTNGTLRATLGNTYFNIEDSVITTFANNTASADFATGAVVVTGGVGIGRELHVQEYIGGNTSGVLQLTNYASDKILVKADTIESPEEIKWIANAPDSSADAIVYPITLAHHSVSGTVVAGSGTGLKFEMETSNDNFEIGGQIDVVAQDVTGTQEDFDMVFSTMIGGTAGVEKLRLSETTSTFTTNLQVNQNLTVNGLLDAAAITASIYADDSTEMLDAISNRLTVVTGQVGELTLTTDLEVQYGGTGVSTFTTNGILYGNTADPVQVTDAAGTSDTSVSYQILTVTSDVDATPVWTDTIDGGSF